MEEEAHLANTFLELHPPTLDTSIENIIHLYITILNEKVGPFEEWYGATSAPFYTRVNRSFQHDVAFFSLH